MTNNYLYLLLMVVVAYLISSFSMPLMVKIAKHIGAMDIPRDNRRVHTKPMPKLGGVGIFLSFLLTYLIFDPEGMQFTAILSGAVIILLTGLIDDVKPIKHYQKLIGQIIAACIVVFYGNILLDSVSVFGYSLDFGLWAYPLTIIFIVATINVINLIDGLDGLSGGISSIFFLTIVIISIIQKRFGTLELSLALIMLGSCLGFLRHNFNPAKIFAGDVGTMFMGYIIGVVALLGFKGAFVGSLGGPILILVIPILDTALAIIRRIIRRQPILEADKDHLHHQFLKMNFSQRKTVLIIYAMSLFFSMASIFIIVKHRNIGMLIYVLIFIGILWFIKHTSIIKKR